MYSIWQQSLFISRSTLKYKRIRLTCNEEYKPRLIKQNVKFRFAIKESSHSTIFHRLRQTIINNTILPHRQVLNCSLNIKFERLNSESEIYAIQKWIRFLQLKMLRVESPSLMWQGNSILIAQSMLPALHLIPGLIFMDRMISLVEKQDKITFKQVNELFLFGFSVMTYPVELIRVRVMSDIGPQREFKGFFDCAKQIRSVDGFRGYFRGIIPHYLGLAFYKGSQFFGNFVVPRNSGDSMFSLFISSQIISLSSGLIAYPLLTIQRQMIMQSARSDVLYNGFFGCAKQMYSTGGVRQFYKGYLVGLIQIYLGSGLSAFLH